MTNVLELLERNQKENYVPHHNKYFPTVLTKTEKESCYSFRREDVWIKIRKI